MRKPLPIVLLVLLTAVVAINSRTLAQTAPAPATLQVFTSLTGTTPNWREANFTVSRLQLGGTDTTGRRFLIDAFRGSQQLTIPRTAASSARLLVSGASGAGQIDRILVTIASATLTIEPGSKGTSPRVVPVTVQDNPLMLKAPQPITLGPGDTRSLVAPIKLGVDAVLTTSGVFSLRPTLAANLFTPTPDNYLNGNETVAMGPTELFSEVNTQVSRSKLVDPIRGTIRDLTLRTDTGAPVSYSDVRAQNETVWRSRHGALDPALVQKLATMANSDQLDADVWIRVDGPATLITNAITPEAWDAVHTDFVNQRRAAAQPAADAASAVLIAAGATVMATELSPPVLHVRASRAVLEGTAALLTQALSVSQTPSESEKQVLATYGARDLVQDPLWLAHLLLAGQGLRIAVAEDLACVETTHEAFQGVFFEAPLDPCGSDGTGAYDGHSTAVMGALAAYVPDTPPGSANTTRPPGGLVGLFQGRAFTANICGNVSDRLLARNPHLINSSCILQHTDGSVDYASQAPYDYAVFTDRIFIANGAGNTDEGIVACPSYNAVCVGGYWHQNTVGPANFGDDTSANTWKNDPATHREKPDLVGPNSGRLPLYNKPGDPTAIQFPNSAYRRDLAGTSFSTPFVVGTAALLMANFPEYLTNDPTLLRAVLMTSATHPIAGLPILPVYSDNIDGKIGAGAPRGDRAKEILSDQDPNCYMNSPGRCGQFFSRYVDRSTDFTTAGDLNQPLEFVANAGEKVRVVMTYDQPQLSMVSTLSRLAADVDLIVTEAAQDGSHSAVHTHASHIDNSELIEFTAPTRSTIGIRAHVQYWDAATDGSRKTHFAIAWDSYAP